MEVVAIRLKEQLSEAWFHRLTNCISEQKRIKILRYFRRIDQERSLLGDIMVRSKASVELGIPNIELRFGANSYGKPHLIGYPGFQFNVTHSGSFVVCAFSTNPVGVDIEQIVPIALELAEAYFSNEESASLMRCEASDRLSYFYELWTLKESYLKLRGHGLSMPLNSFTVQPDPERTRHFVVSNDKGCLLQQVEVDPDYKLSVCAYEQQLPVTVKLLTSGELCESLSSLLDFS